MSSEDLPLYYHPDYERHTQGPGHPESPERVKEILRFVREWKLPVKYMDPVPVDQGDIQLVHSMSHIDRVRDFGVGYMDPDTFHTDETYGFSLRAAGGVLGAARQCIRENRPTFAVPRPPGHHAGFDYNMGFCYFNNVAFAARSVQKEFEDISRVAIVDIDAHHGNGTNDIFFEDPSVLYISTHQWGIFPGTGHFREVGRLDGIGKTVNIPFNWGAGDPTFQDSLSELILPILKQFGPDMVFVSLGADSHLMDPLTGLTLSSSGFMDINRELLEYAKKEAGSRICFELEGGYHTYALGEVFAGTMALAAGLDHEKMRYTETKDINGSPALISEIKETLDNYWKV
jgi:acetoin utilization deacetylase AcuC-like enzyme